MINIHLKRCQSIKKLKISLRLPTSSSHLLNPKSLLKLELRRFKSSQKFPLKMPKLA